VKFDELGDQLKIYEEAATSRLLPGMYTLLKIIYGYFQSDEISLLLDPSDRPYDLKDRKLLSILAGQASVAFTLELRRLLGSKAATESAVFDNRLLQLPTTGLVRDYFRWRNEDAARNALNGYCYWYLRQQGKLSVGAATGLLEGKGVAFKNDLLFNRFKVNFNDVPAWQKRGVGMLWESYIKDGFNPILGEKVQAVRRRVVSDYELPQGEAYGKYILDLLATYSEQSKVGV
jgi:tRNA(His) guanylyltransferase